MDLRQKIEYQQEVESYLEHENVYDLFEYLLKELLIDKPEDPLNYLISKLEKPQRRRLFLLGATGSKKKDVAKELGARFKSLVISLSDLLRDEINKKGKHAQTIEQAFREGRYLQDDVVLEILMPALEKIEKNGSSYLLEGVPRTRVQALALQRAGVIPDRVVIIQPVREEFEPRFREKFVSILGHGKSATDKIHLTDSPECDEAFLNAWNEHNYHVNGVKEVYRSQYHEIEGHGDIDKISDYAARIFLMRGRSNAPRKPPKLVVIGPPCSGRSTQSQRIASRYGLTFVSVTQLLRDQVNRKTELGMRISDFLQDGDLVPDDIVTELVRSRLNETDCKVNGWVLDGFPKNHQQAMTLKQSKLQPTLAFFLEASDALVFDRLDSRRMDPVTGVYYNIRAAVPQEIHSRLIQVSEDTHENGRKRLNRFKESYPKLQAEYARISVTIKAELDTNLITEMMGDAIENSVPHEID